MSVQQVSLFLLIVGVVGCFAGGISAEDGKLWTSSKSLCDDRIKSLSSVPKFIEFAKEIEDTPELNSETTTELIDDCLQSYDGVRDVRKLYKIVQQMQTVHSVCEKDFVNKLLKFNDDITSYGSRSKDDGTTHGLLQFTSSLFGQVALTCKRSLETKLEQAEQSDEALKQSFDVVENDQIARKIVNEHVPSLEVDLPENLLTAGFLLNERSSSDSRSTLLRLESQEAIEQFTNLKRSCQLIGSYAESSIYPIMKLAYRGYEAGDAGDVTDNKLKSSPRVRHWLKTVQYCQAVELAIPHPWEAIPKGLSLPLKAKTFDVAEQIHDIGSDQ